MQPGTRLGPYEVIELLGAGGMGEVWRARDTRLGREVALKLLPAEFSTDPERVTRFQREAQLLAALNHPHIASIYSFETVDGIRVLEMELVPGETIGELLRQGPLPLPRALAFAHDVARALGAAHAKGILHRDLKPANVKVTPEGNVKLLDFGLAKAFAPASGGSDLSESPTIGGGTLRGVILGTVPYMSPEQARGTELDERSDVWSFGCLVFEMLAGKKAFAGPTATDILVAVLDREPDWKALPPDTPLPVVELVKACLAKRVDERLPDLASARKQIDLVRTGQTPPVTVAVASSRPSAGPRRRFLPFAAGGVTLLALAAGIAWVALRGRPARALPATKLLAVLPAADFTGRSDGRQLCDGFSVSLRSKLQHVSGVSIMLPAAARLETDAAKVARDTGANLILAPSARKSGDQVQLSYSLALSTSPVQIDAGEVTGPESDWFRLENELTTKICASLELAREAGPPPRDEIIRGPSQSDYVVALGSLERADDPALLQKAADILGKIPDGNGSALVQAALARAYLSSFALTNDARLAERAKAAAERATRLDPDLPEAQITAARVLRATGRPVKALPVLRKVLERDPRNVEAAAELGAALYGAKDSAGAEAAWKRLVEMRPTSWSSHKDLAGFFFRENRYADAAGEYQRAINLNSAVYGLHYSLAAVRIRQGRFDDAIGALKKSIEIKPSSLAYSNLGACQYLLGSFSEASDSFGKAVMLTPGDYRYHVYLGDALTFMPGQSDKARQAYEAAIPLAEGVLRVNPRDGGATGLLALCQARVGQRDEAARLVERAVALEPEDASVLQRAAIVKLALGRRDESLRLLARAVEKGYGTVEIGADPEFTSLRDDARFQQLLSGASGAGEKQ